MNVCPSGPVRKFLLLFFVVIGPAQEWTAIPFSFLFLIVRTAHEMTMKLCAVPGQKKEKKRKEKLFSCSRAHVITDPVRVHKKIKAIRLAGHFVSRRQSSPSFSFNNKL
jgi:hypothetical protein